MFPLSNWTEIDVWRYIELEGLEIPSIYYAHEREVFERDGILLAVSEYAGPQDGEDSYASVFGQLESFLYDERRIRVIDQVIFRDAVIFNRVADQSAEERDVGAGANLAEQVGS